MKKSSLASLIVLALSVSTAHAATDLHNCEEVLAIPSGTQETYTLANDIECNGFTQANAIDFSGVLEGKGFSISNLTVSYTNTNRNTGLFSRVQGGKVSDLNLINFNVRNAYRIQNGTGALAGYSDPQSVFENIKVSDSHITFDGTSGKGVGSIIGWMAGGQAYSLISEANEIVANEALYLGSVVGYVSGEAFINDTTSSKSTVTSTYGNSSYVGGVFGRVAGGSKAMNISMGGNTINALSLTGGAVGGFSGDVTASHSILSNGVFTEENNINAALASDTLFVGYLVGAVKNGGATSDLPTLTDSSLNPYGLYED